VTWRSTHVAGVILVLVLDSAEAMGVSAPTVSVFAHTGEAHRTFTCI
jgi:hypothetical protein